MALTSFGWPMSFVNKQSCFGMVLDNSFECNGSQGLKELKGIQFHAPIRSIDSKCTF